MPTTLQRECTPFLRTAVFDSLWRLLLRARKPSGCSEHSLRNLTYLSILQAPNLSPKPLGDAPTTRDWPTKESTGPSASNAPCSGELQSVFEAIIPLVLTVSHDQLLVHSNGKWYAFPPSAGQFVFTGPQFSMTRDGTIPKRLFLRMP